MLFVLSFQPFDVRRLPRPLLCDSLKTLGDGIPPPSGSDQDSAVVVGLVPGVTLCFALGAIENRIEQAEFCPDST
jgi:hypothetical protein